jgi:sigma-E factor negative regulatory protein RseB
VTQDREASLFTQRRSADRRRQLLALAAAVAVSVPGCLLMTACSGQSTTVRPEANAEAEASGTTDSGSGSGTTRAIRNRSSALALSLLTEAAQAAVSTSYEGEESVSAWDSGGVTTLTSDIWHVSGGPTVTQTLAMGPGASSQSYVSADQDGQSPEGVLGVTMTLVELLETHYVVSYEGLAAAGNRPARVVEAWRPDGSLAARFWLDEATRLPLERQVFDGAGNPISEGVFINVQIGTPVTVPAARAPQVDGWASPLAPAKLLAFGKRGWVVRSAMPGGLTLFAGGETITTSGPVLDLAYSDGLYVVSVFEQHGKLASKLAGWQKTTIAGRVVYAAEPDQRSLTWSGNDVVYTLIADAPAQTVAAAVGTLPHDAPPGFWKRMSRGFVRLASLVNPFG